MTRTLPLLLALGGCTAMLPSDGLMVPDRRESIRLSVLCVDGLPVRIDIVASRPGERRVELLELLERCAATAPRT